jgi:hypothetical protein
MMRGVKSNFGALLAILFVGFLVTPSAFGAATIAIQNGDAPNVGFNDPTPASPVGGNSGTTVGQQRLNAFQFAADIWGATLSSGPTITIRATWAPLTCNAHSGVLGSAGANSISRDFPGAVPGTWYGTALANAITNSDPNVAVHEIIAQFNVDLGTPGCLQNSHWYYGLDGNPGAGGFDLVTVLLHEFAHGLGFQTFTNKSTGAEVSGFPTIYDWFLLDNSTGELWPEMTDSERAASAVNTGKLVWSGAQVTTEAASVLSSGKDAAGHPRVYAPNPVQGGSSVSHWDPVVTPNQLMEPFINNGLSHNVAPPQDLTYPLMQDIGWCSGCSTSSPTPTPSPPANNDFANAQVVLACTGSVNGTNVAANKEAGEPSHSPDNDPGGASVWYQWQAPSGGSVTFTTAGSDYDTLLGVYTGNNVGSLTLIGRNDDVDLGVVLTSSVTFAATADTIYKIAVDGWGGDTGNITLNWSSSGCPPNTIDSVTPLAGRTTGGQQVILEGSFANLSSVTFGGSTASWNYTNGTSEITVTTPAHAVGAIDIELVPVAGSAYSKTDAFAYLRSVFTDDVLVIGVTTAKTEHIVELRESIDALRAVAGVGPVSWTDPLLAPMITTIKAVHIQELRTNLNSVATTLGYSTQPYTDPALTSNIFVRKVHIEELRQRIRDIAG